MKTKPLYALLNETFVFRPLLDSHRGSVISPFDYNHAIQGLFRYNGGNWIPDDGEYDLAFTQGVFAYGVTIPNYTNLIWSWHDIKLTRSFLPEYLHKYAKLWHEQTVNNTPTDDEHHWRSWDIEKEHPIGIAYRNAMDRVSGLNGCGNGAGPHLCSESQDDAPYLRNKIVLVQSTMKPVEIPEHPICYLCLNNGRGHLIQALKSYKEDLEGAIEEAQETISKAQVQIDDAEYTIKKAGKHLPEVTEELKSLEEGK